MKKPRIAIYYDNRYGRNDGPPLYYKHAMQQMKMDVTHLLPDGDTSRFGKFDYHFWVDWGEDAVIGKQKALSLTPPPDGGKTIYIASDTHLDDGYRFEKAKQFDYVFFNQKNAVDEFTKILQQDQIRPYDVSYLPHAAEPIAFPRFTIIKKYDLVFIGHIQEYHRGNGLNMSRIDVLDYVLKQFPNSYFGSRHPAWPEKNMFEDAAKKFCQSKIVFNISIGNDLNMRFFETLSTGSFLLTNKIPELKSAEKYGFINGVHYVSYKSLEDAVEKANYYIEHDDEREKIAKAGHKQSKLTGTYKSRIKEIVKTVFL